MHFNLAYLITVLFAISVYTAPVTVPSSCVDLDIRDESSFGCGHGHLTVRAWTASDLTQTQLNRKKHWNTVLPGSMIGQISDIYVEIKSHPGPAYNQPSLNLEGYPNIQNRISIAIHEHLSPHSTHCHILYKNRFDEKPNDPNPSALVVAYGQKGQPLKTVWIDEDGVPTFVQEKAQTQASSFFFLFHSRSHNFCSEKGSDSDSVICF
ncbi:hypothetical protein DFH05DRAFT_473412 [Lentinula detonsa]|uniref:Uncharacterized protein n=1 Tax=Lentinula detonsa TaxID=2804962 RepID=A0A9W8TU20_9AGAR|nr:hypothetical protein DFH05DRAFT_473412 [Lentinula detonsa]